MPLRQLCGAEGVPVVARSHYTQHVSKTFKYYRVQVKSAPYTYIISFTGPFFRSFSAFCWSVSVNFETSALAAHP